MNYNQVKSKKKNKLIIIVSLVLSLVLAGGAIAGIGYAFNWFPGWGAEVNEGNADTAKEFPTSSSNLNVSSINDIIGVEFSAEDFSIYFPYNDGDVEVAYYYLNLNVAGYGVDFDMPESGVYNIKFKINDQLFDVNSRFIAEPEGDGGMCMSIPLFKNGTVVPEEVFSHTGYILGMGPCATPSLGMAVDGFCIMLYDFNIDDALTFELVLCNNRSDVVLYKFRRAVGIMLTEIHIIQRTSNSYYKVTSFDFDCCCTKSFRSVIDLCNYIRDTYIPKEYRLLSTQERLKEKRIQRLERIKQEGWNSIGIVDGEFFNTYEKQCAYEEFHRRKYMNRREKK